MDEPARSLAADIQLSPQRVLRFALLTLCVSNLVRLPIADTGAYKPPIILNDILAGLVIVTGTLVMMRWRALRIDDVTFAALLFAAVGGLSTVSSVPRIGLTAFEVVLSLAYLARWIWYLGLYVVVINTVRYSDASKVWSALETAMLLFAAFGIVQAAFLPNFAFTLHPDAKPWVDFDPQGHRLVSTMLDPNLAAAMILSVLLVQLAQISTGVSVPMWKPALMFVALVLTMSRSGALSFLVGAVVIVSVRGVSRRMLRFAGVGLVMFLATLPQIIPLLQKYSRLTLSDPSAFSRVIGWTRAIGTFLDYPWIGIGFNTYGFVQERRGVTTIGVGSYSVEGGLLFIAVMTGIVGVLLYSAMLARVLARCRRTWRIGSATPEQRALAIGAAAVTVAYCVDSLFTNSLLTPATMEPLWVLWGLAFVANREARLRRAGS